MVGTKRPLPQDDKVGVSPIDTNTDTDTDTDTDAGTCTGASGYIGNTGTHPCLPFLPPTKEERPFSVRHSETHGVTMVASKALAPGCLLFRLPSECLLTYERVCSTPLSQLIRDLISSSSTSSTADDVDTHTDTDADITRGLQISPEELTWLNMIVWLHFPEDEKLFHIYLKALDVIPPVASSWPKSLQDQLKGSNVYAVLEDSGNSDKVVGNVVVIQNLLKLLDRLRGLLKQQNTSTTHTAATAAIVPILSDEGKDSIFSARSISWARGHFLSRRFPDRLLCTSSEQALRASSTTTRPPNKHTPGYGHATSAFIPVLDLMNHNPTKPKTCTITMSRDGRFLDVRTGEVALEAGDELFYCYGETLSNEVLLQGYGFCLPNNPADTVSVKISKIDNAKTDTSTNTKGKDCGASSTFCIGRGGAQAIPSDMWRAIAGVATGDEEQEVEIGSGDLECLLEYMTSKLTQLNSNTTTATNNTHQPTTVAAPSVTQQQEASNSTSANNNLLSRERQAFIDIYKNGQREILEELIRDLSLMLED
jgi:hypothetical protein